MVYSFKTVAPQENLRWTQAHAETVNIRLIDQLGRECYKTTLAGSAGQQEYQINLRLASGVYIAEIRTTEGKQQQLLVISN